MDVRENIYLYEFSISWQCWFIHLLFALILMSYDQFNKVRLWSDFYRTSDVVWKNKVIYWLLFVLIIWRSKQQDPNSGYLTSEMSFNIIWILDVQYRKIKLACLNTNRNSAFHKLRYYTPLLSRLWYQKKKRSYLFHCQWYPKEWQRLDAYYRVISRVNQ